MSSARGPGGGYRLSRNADEINVAQVIEAVDEKVSVTRCGGKGDCQNGEACLTHKLWCSLSDQIHGFLDGISLGSLVDEEHVKLVAERQLKDASNQESKEQSGDTLQAATGM